MDLLKDEKKLILKCPNYTEDSEIPGVFVIGFNKCGTASIHFFFLLNNIKSLHWYRGFLGKEINKNINNKNLLGNLSNFYVYSDCEELRKNFKLFEKRYPNAKFILNIRDVKMWLLSRLNHKNGKYLEYWNKINNKHMNFKQIVKYWHREWFEHINNVKKYFSDKKNKLLIIDIEKDDFQENIINFIGSKCLKKMDIHVHKTKKKLYFPILTILLENKFPFLYI